MSNIQLKQVEDNDIYQLKIWLNKKHVLKWYHDPEEWLTEIKERNGRFSFLKHFIVLNNNMAIGFCQFYDCFDAQEDWYSVKTPNKVFSIDYFIGDEDNLRKGFGKEIVNLLVGKVYELSANATIIVQPENENVASCKVLTANEFVFDFINNYYILKTNHAEL